MAETQRGMSVFLFGGTHLFGLQMRLRDFGEHNDHKGNSEDGHGDNHGGSSVADGCLAGGSSDKVAQQDGSNGTTC